MSDLSKLSLKIRNYKCFEGEEQGYDVILPINVIIGRNNSGKSSLLDLIDQATSPKDIDGRGHNGYKPCVIFSDAISEDQVPTRQVNYDQHIMNELKPWIGLKMKWEMSL